jgi:hypothetical protein
MNAILKILLIEESQAECREMVRYVDTLDDVRLVIITNMVNSALQHVQDLLSGRDYS